MIVLPPLRLVPDALKKRGLSELIVLTADAFQLAAPDLKSQDFESSLIHYAQFTHKAAERICAQGGDLEAVEKRLYAGSLRRATELRRQLNISSEQEARRATQYLYRIIGISLAFEGSETLVINQCFFSTYYSPQTCKLISALDRGLVEGLGCGTGLRFTERMTEGCERCRATIGDEEGT